MVNGFLDVPDWFAFENQGAGIALTSLNGTQNDLLVLTVDSRIGKNRGYYKVGKNLDASGNPMGGWSDWFEIPDWFSAENQGAGLAVADLDRNGRPDLIVFMIDNPVGKNRGLYRIGRNLDGEGVVTGGWTDWLDVDDWFGFDNQGGGIAVADLKNNGKQDLIVLMIDAPAGKNQGLYKIGRDLDAAGTVKGGWSGWMPVPEWFSWENQGGGVAIADIENNGQKDIIVFQIDNPVGQNQAFFKVGKGLSSDGHLTGEWSPWYGIPGWFSWENQGGSIAAARLSSAGQYQLMALMVDNPLGKNAGLYRVLELGNDPAAQGKWELLPYNSEVLAVHAAVLPKGKVLFFAGSGNSAVRFLSADFGDTGKGFWCSVVWDPMAPAHSAASFFHPDTLRTPDHRPIDFFCGGDTFLADGRLLSAGGTEKYDVDGHDRPSGTGFVGRKEALLFDPDTQQWRAVASMARGRWYPTLVTLGDGRVLAVSGLVGGAELNRRVEVFSPYAAEGSWHELNVPPLHEFLGFPLYAHLILLADGRLFFTGGRMDDALTTPPCLADITQNPIGIRPVAGLEAAFSRNQSASVLLPPAQEQKIMIMGGALPIGELNATDRVDIIDLSNLHDPLPSYQPAAPLLLPRVHLNAVLLPDHTVFVSGGALQREGGEVRKTVARHQSEIYDPETNTWHMAATATAARMYHSIALLLPDGRVVAAGGNPDKGHHVEWNADPNEEMHLEVYSPPYLFRAGGTRPTIDKAPSACTYGETLTIRTPQAGNIKWASLIRNGVTTHSFDTGQRLVDLDIVAQGSGSLQAKVTSERNIAPPGWYMLFLTDQRRVPSVARWIHLQ
jgi:hypothetical protein